MVDVGRIREALDAYGYPDTGQERIVVDAARAYVRLAETGREIPYCETHKAEAMPDVCDMASRADGKQDCHIVCRFLSVLPDED